MFLIRSLSTIDISNKRKDLFDKVPCLLADCGSLTLCCICSEEYHRECKMDVQSGVLLLEAEAGGLFYV